MVADDGVPTVADDGVPTVIDDGNQTLNYVSRLRSDYRNQSNPDYGRITVIAVAWRVNIVELTFFTILILLTSFAPPDKLEIQNIRGTKS